MTTRWLILLAAGIGGAVLGCIAPVYGLAVLTLVVIVSLWFVRPGSSLRSLLGWLGRLTAVIAAGGIGWLGGALAAGLLGPRTPPPPDTIRSPLDTSQRAAVLDYARSLTFAEYNESTGVYPTDRRAKFQSPAGRPNGHGGKYHGQWDKNLVDTLGDVVIVEPEVNIHRSWKRDLRRGRIQMRIRLRVGRPGRDPRQIYESLGVPPGVSYVWIDGFELTSRDSGYARAVVFPVDPALPVRIKRMRVYRGERFNRAVARWTPALCNDCHNPYWCSG